MSRRSYRNQYPRLYKRYAEHGLGEPGATLTKREVRAAAEIAGFSPGEAKQMMQIARGESGLRPGIRGDDPGGTKGRGLVQNTPGVWGQAGIDYMNKLGGEKALQNPVKNMKMARFLYESAGNSFTPWYGTSFLDENLDRSKVKSVLGKRGPSGVQGKKSPSGRTIPGVDNGPLRQQLLQQYLAQDYDPNALLGLAQGLEGAQDIPGVTVPGVSKRGGTRNGRGRDVVTATGQSVNKMLSKAVKWDKAKAPYLWGGGHGAIAKPGQPVDCSGYVSAVLGLDTPQVSGNLASWGKPGKGRWVSVYANDGHVLMSIRDPKTRKVRWFGTSRSNPGGGAGEISPPDASYLSSFTARHPG
jgi:hypothetical protein